MFNIASLLVPLLFLHSFSPALCQNMLHIMTLNQDDSSYTTPLQAIGVSVNEDKLNEVSNNILKAENWLRTHVLLYYPSTNINSVIVTNKLLCNDENTKNREDVVKLVMASMKNLFYSLTRWGLEREIKVTVSVPYDCLQQLYLKPLFSLLESINSTYSVNPTQFSDETVKLLSSELKSMNGLGGLRLETVNVIVPTLNQAKSTSRKLSFIDDLWSVSAPPPPEAAAVVEFSPTPEMQPPVMAPAGSPSHPYGYSLPPCNPYPHGYHAVPPVRPPAAAPSVVGKVGEPMAAPPMLKEELWCVAKPSVPSEKLQVALDYACGAGGADCGPIRPNGSCYSPDSVVAHASYAFNSYWQKNKKKGGVCGFEGTAMLISTDPSFLHCRFILA